jgi:hypothetical protein
MNGRHTLDDVLVKVADGEPVDWDRLTASALEDDDREWLAAMRILDEVANAHRAISDSPFPPAPRPRRWGKYLLTERLGAGSFGEVYRAWDPSLQRHVAIKLLHPGLPGGDTVSGRLLEEGQRLASVRHPNIVSVLEVEQHGGRPALCMEFVRGRTLDEVVRLEGRLGAREAAHIGIAVCGALEAVHAAGLIHRDVKANNVMRDDSGRIVLMDFGSGIRLLGDALPRAAVGTPLYMAPELFEGANATPASDVYGVGVLLYFLVSGQYPVEGSTVDAMRHAHRTGAAQPLADRCAGLPAAFVDAVDRARCPKPAARYDTAQELADDLRRVMRSLDRHITLLHAVSVALGTAAGALLLILSLGFLTSATYSFLLGIRAPFVSEGWLDHFVWGARSLVAPAAMAAFVTGTLYLALECFALARKMSRTLGRLAHAVRGRARRLFFTHRIELRDWARLAVLGSVAFLLWVPLIGFPDLVRACLASPLASAPADALRLLGPPGGAIQDTYRQALSLGVTVMCAVWMTLWRAARRRETTLGTAGWLGLGCLIATMVVMAVPYRVAYHNVTERAQYEDSQCYVTGDSTDAVLLFCPSRQPRVLSVNRADPKFTRLATYGSIFETVR